MSDTTPLLSNDKINSQGAEELLPLVYTELRRMAAARLAQESPGQTLQPTALVHEVWLRLAGSSRQRWQNSRHFLGAAAEAMRRILIDNARRKKRLRHGGALVRVDLDRVDFALALDAETFEAVETALQALAREDPLKAELVNLRFFVGLGIPDAAAALGLSESTAKRHWAYARAWLYDALQNQT